MSYKFNVENLSLFIVIRRKNKIIGFILIFTLKGIAIMEYVVFILGEIVDLIKTNIVWIKDLGTLIFSIVGTLIAILTYRRAKATILQPIRCEVIKKQSEILTQLLEYVYKGLEEKIGYIELANVNCFMILKKYGFVLNNDKEIMNGISETIKGWIPCGEHTQLLDVEIVPMLKKDEENEAEGKELEYSKKLFEKARSGIIAVDKIYLTKEYCDFDQTFSQVHNLV